MTNFLILGTGKLGIAVSEVLRERTLNFSITSARSACKSPSLFQTLEYFPVIIDCMDLSHDNYPHYLATQSALNDLRTSIISSNIYARYSYISTANLYLPTTDYITETSPIYKLSQIPLHGYLHNKLIVEHYLHSLADSRIQVMRCVSLHMQKYQSHDVGFFPDLRRSQINGYPLKERKGDDELFSLMTYRKAASRIVDLLAFPSSVELYNITARHWTTRSALKRLKSRHKVTSAIAGRKVISNYY